MTKYHFLLYILYSVHVLNQYFVLNTLADVYLHNPRGSNNRLNEDARARNNGKRLFDSQNNVRGGYNVGYLNYLAGSKLQIEWTNQHSCSDANTKCEIVLQYMCHQNLRDGVSTGTIPETNTKCLRGKCATDFEFGMHEDNDYYNKCKRRERNKGLFTADQKINRDVATRTRQNPIGTRFGYECPEERDYYPYWHPTPWKDIAVLTDTPSRCKFYRQESANVKERWDCHVPATKKIIPSTAEGCRKVNGSWTRTPPHGIPPPVCREPEWTRDNHLGNTKSGFSPVFNWTVPASEGLNSWCTLRIRYNISTSDYDAWSTNAGGFSKESFAKKLGFGTSDEAQKRGYDFKVNPTVEIFKNSNAKLKLKLAINTAQFGRVFQDRSHAFTIQPTSVKGTIHNLNVRGKRGNIVQVYPSVEYDFTPNRNEISVDDHIHFQWTGSNTNNGNNDGQGVAGSDRNNVLLQANAVFPEPVPKNSKFVFGFLSRSYPALYNSTVATSLLSFSRDDLRKLAYSGTFTGDVQYLNSASTYFDLGPRKITSPGTYHYMCTRNNNFSNRSQKGIISCSRSTIGYYPFGTFGGVFSPEKFTLDVPPGAFSELGSIRYELMSAENGKERVKDVNGILPSGDGFAGDFLIIGFPEIPKKPISITMKVDTSKSLLLYRGNAKTMLSWERLQITKSSSDSVSFATNRDGVFILRYNSSPNAGLIAGLTILAVALVSVIIVGLVLFFRRNPSALRNLRSMLSAKV